MNDPFRAWLLPLEPDPPHRQMVTGELTCAYPQPTPELVREAVRQLRSAGARLAERPVDAIIRAVDAAVARLADSGDPLRRSAERLIAAATGYSPAMVRLVLDRMTADWRAEPLRRLLDAEFGGDAVLDGFAPHAGSGDTRTLTRAYGPDVAFHVFAGNVPGVAVTSLIRALLVKAPSLGKLAAGEPVLPVLFGRALASVDDELAACIALTYWPGGAAASGATLQAAIDEVDAVVVYGGESAADGVRQRVAPGRRLVVHGPRFSAGAIGVHELDGGLGGAAARAARAVATFDQQGCVSPQALWVEDPDGSRAREFARHLAAQLERLERDLPRGRIPSADSSAIQQERGSAEMRAQVEEDIVVWKGEGTTWTVVLESEPGFRGSCLNRFVRVHPLPDLALLPEILRETGPYLQSFALEGAGHRRQELADRLARAGASRITSFARLPWPPAHWHHDGAAPLRELVRWVDLES